MALVSLHASGCDVDADRSRNVVYIGVVASAFFNVGVMNKRNVNIVDAAPSDEICICCPGVLKIGGRIFVNHVSTAFLCVASHIDYISLSQDHRYFGTFAAGDVVGISYDKHSWRT